MKHPLYSVSIDDIRRVDSLDIPFIVFKVKGLSTAPHRTGRAVFPHPALQTVI